MANSKRGTTPFAYATPHSGPVTIDNRGRGDGSTGGTDEGGKREEEDDVWEGVESEGVEVEGHEEVVGGLVERFWEESGGGSRVDMDVDVKKEQEHEDGDEFFDEESAAWDS